MRSRLIAVSGLACIAASLVALRVVMAGPPSICWPLEIGDAKSLDWSADGWRAPDDLDRSKVADEVVRLTAAESSPIVRMETLRRAAVALQDREEKLTELIVRLMARAIDAHIAGADASGAWFDAGYFTACVDQLGRAPKWTDHLGSEAGIRGYGWVAHAIESSPEHAAQMHLGAALMTVGSKGPMFESHLAAVREAAARDALVKANLDFLERPLDDMRGWRAGR